jgi:GxxExxY protein
MEHIYENKTYVMSRLTAQIIGCAIRVHKALGPGYEEAYYQKALIIELTAAGLDVRREVGFDVYYTGQMLGTKRVDLVVEDCLVELKAKKSLEEIDAAQVVSYLKASGYPVGLLINFGDVKVQTKRFANTTRSCRFPKDTQDDSAPHSLQRLSDSGDKETTCQT